MIKISHSKLFKPPVFFMMGMPNGTSGSGSKFPDFRALNNTSGSIPQVSSQILPEKQSLSEIEILINEILNIKIGEIALRSQSDWLRLHERFFGYFIQGKASEEEKKALEIALSVINKTRATIAGTPQATLKDFIDQKKDFKKDFSMELREDDFSFQPRKSLLLMAGLVGRVLAGWKAEEVGFVSKSQFQDVIIGENRANNFLAYVFNHYPEFSVFDYLNVGLIPIYIDLSSVIIKQSEGLKAIKFVPPQGNLFPYLKLFFNKPFFEMISNSFFNEMGVTVLKAGRLPTDSFGLKSDEIETEKTFFEEYVFDEDASPEEKKLKTNRLLILLIERRLLLMHYRASLLGARRLAEFIGRTEQERLVIERFFSLGFLSGGGNDPWPFDSFEDKGEVISLKRSADEIKKLQAKIEVIEFFNRYGLPEAGINPGSRARKEIFARGAQVRRNFLKLAEFPSYLNFVKIFMAPDRTKGWIIDEREVNDLVKKIDSSIALLLIDSVEEVKKILESFSEEKHRLIFLYKLNEALFKFLLAKSKYSQIEKVLETLREFFGLEKADIPDVAFSIDFFDKEKFIKSLEIFKIELLNILEPEREERLREKIFNSENYLFWWILHTSWKEPASADFQKAFAEVNELKTKIKNYAENKVLSFAIMLRQQAEKGDFKSVLETANILKSLLTGLENVEERKKIEGILRCFYIWVAGLIEEKLQKRLFREVEEMTHQTRVLLSGLNLLEDFNLVLKDVRKKLETVLEQKKPAVPVVTLDKNQIKAREILQRYQEYFSKGKDRLTREFLEAVLEGKGPGFPEKEKLARYFEKHMSPLNWEVYELLKAVSSKSQ